METTESAGSGDDEPGSSKLGSQALPTAAAPTQREKEEHFVSHYPFRSWCEHCIRGKAKAMRHVKVDHSDETVPVISADYCFMNSVDDTVITEEVQKKHAPVLIVHDRWSKLTYAHVLPYKGVTQGPIGSKCLLNDLKKFVYPKMVMRYDPEPALNSVVEAAKNGFDKQLVLEKVPQAVSESKGEIERAVQAIESQSRTLRSALETSYGRKVPDDHPVLTWLVEHASTTYNLFHRSLEVKDGKTPYSRHRGREWRVSLPPFGETIEFLKRGHKFEQRWHQGVFLGVKDNTTEKIVGNASGVFTVQSIRRKSADDRYDVETLMSVTGVPWDPQASKRDDILLPQIVEGDQQPLAPSVPVESPKKSTRRLYITKRDLDKYGYTAGCVACDATRIGKRGTGVHHTPACRERMERLLQAEEGNLRVAQHTAKVDSEITGQKQEVSEEGTKILYGYSSERPQGVPQGFKVFARLDRNARYLKGTMPEGPSWDNVWWRVTREFKTGDMIKSEPIDPNLGEDVINAPLIDDTDIVTELWYSATGESAPSLPTAGTPGPVVQDPTADPVGVGASASSASAKRAGGEQEERSHKRLEMSPTKGQKRPADSGGETSKAKDSRAASAQASKGTKRPPENERPDDMDDIDQCLMNLIMEDRERYLQSIEGEEEPVCEETIPLPPELEDEAVAWYYYDDISGKILDSKGVEQARKDEVEIIESFPVWEKIPRHKMPKGVRTIGTRWVDVNKQDEENPLYRSRLVAQEVKKGSGFDEFFAAMPSLSALKMLVTIAVTFQLPDAGKAVKEAYRKRRLLGFLDVKRAHFYSDATREIYVELPAEAKKPGEDVVGRLLKSLYGTRDAPLNWELQIQKVMLALGFKQGKSNPCICYHAGRDLRTVVHGDDFTTAGTFDNIKWLHEELSKKWKCVERGILGPPGTPNTIQDIRVLNRIITWKENGIWWEPDARHAELVIDLLGDGPRGAKVKTPLAKGSVEDLKDAAVFLNDEEATQYRSVAMRAAYLAQDRPDLQVATRSLAQGLQRPTTSHMLMLKRVARYLRYRPRMAQFFPYQNKLSPFVMWSDADHAGCVKTRKSVSGGVLMAGGCCIKTYSKGQGVVSLSSGESEYYALVSGASNLLGEVSTAKDWGLQPESEVFMDASAGIAMGSRRLGKAKHVDTQYHWVQDRVAKRYFRLKKVDTGDMLADVLTKPVIEEKMNKALRNMNFHFLEGEHHLTLKA